MLSIRALGLWIAWRARSEVQLVPAEPKLMELVREQLDLSPTERLMGAEALPRIRAGLLVDGELDTADVRGPVRN